MKHPQMLYFASFSELWERFSFYIVEALLVIYLVSSQHLPQTQSYQIVGTYIANSFILTVFGAYFGQNVIGFKASIYLGAFLMALGYAFLLDIQTQYLTEALALIALGSSFFKPNMACFIGSLYKIKSSARYAAAYNIYYASIMLGVILSTSISGYVVHYFGWDTNFFLAASAMLMALFIFWIGNRITRTSPTFANKLINFGNLRWILTLFFCISMWFFVHYTLKYPVVANVEFITTILVLLGIFFYESSRTNSKPHFYSCLILLFFSGVYWALLFQQFFSFNIMITQLVNRNIGNLHLPAPFFMGIESLFVIVFSSLISKLRSHQLIQYSFFYKYALAFAVCSVSFFILLTALMIEIKPHFSWIIFAYALLGLGEAILAPTALAMIAPLNRENMLGIMMASLYVFWGLGTKMADVLAQLSITPAQVTELSKINTQFIQAISYYALIAVASCLSCLLLGLSTRSFSGDSK